MQTCNFFSFALTSLVPPSFEIAFLPNDIVSYHTHILFQHSAHDTNSQSSLVGVSAKGAMKGIISRLISLMCEENGAIAHVAFQCRCLGQMEGLPNVMILIKVC